MATKHALTTGSDPRNENKNNYGRSWYAAGITNRDARDFEFKTDFLDDGEWKAEMFIDDKESDRQPTKYIHTTGVIKKGDAFKVWMAEGGGFIVRFSR